MRVLFIPFYSEQWASSRHRVYFYIERLRKKGILCNVLKPHRTNFFSRLLYAVRLMFYLLKTDVVFIQKRVFPEYFFRLIKLFNNNIIFDFDDALFVFPDVEPTLIKILKGCKHIVAGNEYLKNYALNYNKNVTVVPTPIDCQRHRPITDRQKAQDSVIIGWIGMSNNLLYLEKLKEVFDRINERKNGAVKLEVICDKPFLSTRLETINQKWELDSELEVLRTIDIGIMPLTDDAWARGKCAYKALLFMSLGIPVVASPVGMNTEVIQDGINGFLAQTDDEWLKKLFLLSDDEKLRCSMGMAGRKTIEESYSYEAVLPKLIWVFDQTLKAQDIL